MTTEVSDAGVASFVPSKDTTNKSGSLEGSFNKKKFVWLKALMIWLAVITVIIVAALIVSRVISNNQGDMMPEDAVMENDAFYDAAKIDEAYKNGGYTLDGAISAYEERMGSGNNKYKVYMAIYYARFVLENVGDVDAMVGIMDGAKPLIGKDKNVLIDFYAAFRGLYDGVDENMYNYYNDEVVKLVTVENVNEMGLPIYE